MMPLPLTIPVLPVPELKPRPLLPLPGSNPWAGTKIQTKVNKSAVQAILLLDDTHVGEVFGRVIET